MAADEGMDGSDVEPRRVPLVVPDLGVGGPVTVSLWLMPRGARVLAGDRVVELLAGAATVDLEAPIAGILVAHLVDEDEPVTPGTVVAEILPTGAA